MSTLHFGDVVRSHARMTPARIGARDLSRSLTFDLWNRRACRLANALAGLGLVPGDRIAVLAFNCAEWMEIYAATAKAGLVAVPLNFRLVGAEIRFIVEDCGARALIIQDDLVGPIEEIRPDLGIADQRFVHFGGAATPAGFSSYEDLIERASEHEPEGVVRPADPWMLMYTSGTTGRPKGAIRTHGAGAVLPLVTAIELGFGRADTALLAMPMCHANSHWFATTLTTCGGTVSVYSRRGFDPEHFFRVLCEDGASFTSLVPTQYVMMLDLPASTRAGAATDRIAKLMISSAPARRETKQAVMELFPKAGLFELYGSTEAGWVTMLHPDEQIEKLGSVGRECIGSGPIRLLDENGREVADGETGELFSRTPYHFAGYWNLPEKTTEALRGDYCSVGDMARRDADGFYYLVDRKSNMIISGGENIYPSEVEAVLARHPAVREVAVIGAPDATWGETVHAVVVPAADANLAERELLEWSRAQLAGYKRPRAVTIIAEEDMPRTATGKIQHRILKDRIARRLAAGSISGA